MSRVELLHAGNAPISIRQFFADGDPGPILAALANVPELVGPTLGFIGAALGSGAASTRHKEFAILRTSALMRCRYCVDTHSIVALDVGLSRDEVLGLRGERTFDEAFPDPAERDLLGWIDAMVSTTGPIDDALWEPVRTTFADHVLIELSATIGATIFLNRFATGFELPTAAATCARLHDEGLA